MTYEEISNMIKSFGLPYAYYQFPEGTATVPPFICFYYEGNNDLIADNINYAKVEHLVIELYTPTKDFALETLIGATLNEKEIPYTRYESYIDSEKLYMNTFESEVYING